MDKIVVPAPAKINLSLDIKDLREDGYHQLEMIMQAISLYDIIELKKSDKEIDLSTSDHSLPLGPKNLAYQAADLFLNEVGLRDGVDIFIEKNIPIAAGLAGGSSDAAAVLRGLNKLYDIGLTSQQLKEIGGQLGSDIPFCIEGGTAFATGRGDDLEQLPDIEETDCILVSPPIEVSTAQTYANYDRLQPQLSIPTRNLVTMIREDQQIDWSAGWLNILEPVTEEYFPQVQIIKDILAEFSPLHILMSGSGPSVYAVVDSKPRAEQIIREWPREEDFITYCQTIGQNKRL